MIVVFMGTPEFAVPSLEAIRSAGHVVPLVVTQPDRPAGRGRASPVPPPVKVAAAATPVLQPEDANASEVLSRIREARPDVLVVVAFGQKLGSELLGLAPRGCVNAHASLLPRFRGASPIASAVLKGERETGVSLIRLVEKMDAGPVLARRALPIGPEDTTGSLETRLATVAGDLLRELLEAWQTGRQVPEQEQDASLATYARKLKKEDGVIRWERSARHLDCLVRGMQPWPTAFTWLLRAEGHSTRVVLRRVRPLDGCGGTPPGRVLSAGAQGLVVTTGVGDLELLEIQPENRRVMDARSFINGWHVGPGDRFGTP